MAMDPNPIIEWLEELGYHVAHRESGWCEYFVSRGEEHWIGRGMDRSAAIQNALAQMFPSFAAMVIVQTRIAGDRSGPWGRETSDRDTGDRETGARARAAAHAGREQLDRDRVREQRSADRHELSGTETIAPTRRAPVEMGVPEAEEEMHRLKAMIADGQSELGLSNPDRQRLVILGWIARARWIQDMFPGERDIEGYARDIAGTLASFCKRWWPGNVRALQRHSNPEDVTRDLLVAGIHAPHPVTWKKIAQLSTEALARMEAQDAAAGCDDYGWRDGAMLHPPSGSPDTLLKVVADEVRAVTGALGLPKPIPQAPEPQQYLSWVRKLRWLRCAAEDAETWADLAGRLRYLAQTYGSLLEEGAAELHPEYRPERPWAELLPRVAPGANAPVPGGHKERSRQVREVFESLPSAGSSVPELADWLGRALRFADTHMDSILDALEPVRARVLALGPGDLAGAAGDVAAALVRVQGLLAGEPVPAEADGDETPASPPGSAGADPGGATGFSPESLARVLPHTRGQQVAVVSPHRDEELLTALQATLELDSVQWFSTAPEGIDDAVREIGAGDVGLVLAAIGLQAHEVDSALANAATAAGVPFVRANRGRLSSCIRVLGRWAASVPDHSAAGQPASTRSPC